MASNKSRANPERGALAPQRRRGELRVASLMESAAAVIAERGFEAATMAEIAARAGAQVGSLYRFFPNKEALADALIQRYRELVDEAFVAIEARLDTLSVDALADLLLNVLVELHPQTRGMVALLEARSDWSARRGEFRAAAIQRIARLLRLRAPRLRPARAEDVAVVLLHNMKTMKALTIEPVIATSPGAPAELREMNRLYLASRLAKQ